MGPQADNLVAASQETGAPVPKAILDAPVLTDAYQLRVNDAFWKLSTCRAVGMGALGPIPWDAADKFAARNHFNTTEIEYDSFMFLINALDEEFLKHQHTEIEREKANQKHGNTGSFRPSSKGARRRRPRKRR